MARVVACRAVPETLTLEGAEYTLSPLTILTGEPGTAKSAAAAAIARAAAGRLMEDPGYGVVNCEVREQAGRYSWAIWVGAERLTVAHIVVEFPYALRRDVLQYLLEKCKPGECPVDQLLLEATERLGFKRVEELIPLEIRVEVDHPVKLRLVDTRVGVEVNPWDAGATKAVAMLTLAAKISLAYARETGERVLLVVDLPEMGATGPFTRYAIGFMLGGLPYEARRVGASMDVLLITYSRQAIGAALAAAAEKAPKDAERPRVYVHQSRIAEAGKLVVKVREWWWSGAIPGVAREPEKELPGDALKSRGRWIS